jgi:NADH-quinone oxidoreductase subunit J
MEVVLFIVLGAIAITAALGVILARKPIYSALSLLVNFCSLAGLYLLLNAQFLAAAQVIVYAGAIVVLFLFATMLLGGGAETANLKSQIPKNYLAIALAVVLFLEVGYVLVSATLTGTQGSDTPEAIASVGNVQAIGKLLFTDYLLPFELAAVLLLIGIVGAVVLAKRKPNTQYPISNIQD